MDLVRSARTGLGSRVHVCFLMPDLYGGVPRRPAIVHGTFIAAFCNATGLWLLVLGGVLTHYLMYRLTKHDKAWVSILIAYWQSPRGYRV
jgi:type IV secretory pathway TrbD component